MTSTSKLGKEVVAYMLGPPPASGTSSDKGAPSHAAVVNLSNPSASSPLALLRGTTPFPSSSSFSAVVSQDATSTLIVHADRQRPLIHVHAYDAAPTSSASSSKSKSITQTCPLIARLHPSEPTPTLALSPRGDMLAAGSASGRLYVWNVASGHLLASVDAHFRAVSCLQWTACGQALVSGGKDARILIWTVEALMDGGEDEESTLVGTSSLRRPMPYAMLVDHVEGITAISLSSSTQASISAFPTSLRILSASTDETVKLWDVRTRTLVATWTMPGPVLRLATDVGFRSFFALVRKRLTAATETEGEHVQEPYDFIARVDLFTSSSDEVKTLSTGTSSASMVQVSEGPETLVHKSKPGKRITSLAISTFGTHLLLGTSDAQMITVDVNSGVAIRTSSLLAVGAEGSSAKSGGAGGGVEVTSLQTFLVQDVSALFGSVFALPLKRTGDGSAWQVAEKLDRTMDDSRDFRRAPPTYVRLEKRDLTARLHAITPPSLLRSNETELPSHTTADAGEQESLRRARQRVQELERDNEKLNSLLKRAQTTNAGLWERLVKDAADKPDSSTAMKVDM